MNATKKPDDPRAWLERSRSNLLIAESGLLHGVFLEDLCFEAQQAAEKALKAVCIFYQIEFPRTHSMNTLTALLEQAGIQMPAEVREADLLTSYAVQARYPDWEEAVTDLEYQHALVIARHVVSWAQSVITE
jgi:HEPN domain-containing protein